MVKMIIKEIGLRKNYLSDDRINTIYFGGGTPSLLNEQELSSILEAVYKNFNVQNGAEITLEANPDDLNEKNLRSFLEASINRLSIGIQTFDEGHLKFLNRVHTKKEAFDCVKISQAVGFQNISIDLIYGIPANTHNIWHEDLQHAVDLSVQHISSYCLTVERDTVFGKWLKAGKLKPEDEEFSATQFEYLIDFLSKNKFEQYEISNFSKAGFVSRHNSSYWFGEKYLGIGPGAHSYDGTSRQYNVAHNHKYIDSLSNNTVPSFVETLDANSRLNEYILTNLRTKWGLNLEVLEKDFGMPFDILNLKIESYLKKDLLRKDANIVKLTPKGMLIADNITSDLFII